MARRSNSDGTEELRKAVKITQVKPTVQLNDDGTVSRMINVEFTVNDHGPFSQQMLLTEFDEGALLEQVLMFAAKVVKLMALEV